MTEFLVTAILGIMLCVIGVINTTGNVSSLHWYHRQRVTEADRKPFGRLVGLGTIIIGIGLIIFGVLSFFNIAWLTILGTVILVLGCVIGLGLNFYAMIKYNIGIF